MSSILEALVELFYPVTSMGSKKSKKKEVKKVASAKKDIPKSKKLDSLLKEYEKEAEAKEK